MRIINLTDHPVIIFDGEWNEVRHVFPPSWKTARVFSESEQVGEYMVRYFHSDSKHVPEFEEWTYYIVSNVVRTAMPHRKDLCSPNGPVKNRDGANVWCKSLILNP